MARKSLSFAQFFYRVNSDNTIDSICGDCFLTIATARTQTELRSPESNHDCRNSLSPFSEPNQAVDSKVRLAHACQRGSGVAQWGAFCPVFKQHTTANPPKGLKRLFSCS
jgi:hypothetical protein